MGHNEIMHTCVSSQGNTAVVLQRCIIWVYCWENIRKPNWKHFEEGVTAGWNIWFQTGSSCDMGHHLKNWWNVNGALKLSGNNVSVCMFWFWRYYAHWGGRPMFVDNAQWNIWRWGQIEWQFILKQKANFFIALTSCYKFKIDKIKKKSWKKRYCRDAVHLVSMECSDLLRPGNRCTHLQSLQWLFKTKWMTRILKSSTLQSFTQNSAKLSHFCSTVQNQPPIPPPLSSPTMWLLFSCQHHILSEASGGNSQDGELQNGSSESANVFTQGKYGTLVFCVSLLRWGDLWRWTHFLRWLKMTRLRKKQACLS